MSISKEQLQQAQKDRKDGISTYSDSEEEFTQLLKEVERLQTF